MREQSVAEPTQRDPKEWPEFNASAVGFRWNSFELGAASQVAVLTARINDC
jgi:hypothetical protein